MADLPVRGPGRRRTTALVVVLVIGAAALLLSACSGGSGGPASPTATGTGPNGVEKLSATQIVEKSKAAAKAASWVHVRGTQSGTTLDLTIGTDTATGTVTEGGLTAQLLAVGGTTYLKGDKAFWDNASGVNSGDVLAGKWVIAGDTAGTDTQGLDTFTDVGRMVDALLTPTGDLTKTGTSTVDGQRVVGVMESSDSSTLLVALDGPPYPVRIEAKVPTSDPPTFSDWNVPVTITPPPADQIVDPAKLGG